MVYPKESVKEEVPECQQYVTIETHREDREYLSNRIRDQSKKIRILVRILVDKKIIGPELAKTFEETTPNKDILEWYLDSIKTKKE